jgi:hypothetical protein
MNRSLVHILHGSVEGKNRVFTLIYMVVLFFSWVFSEFLTDDLFFFITLSFSFFNLFFLRFYSLGLIPIFSYFFIAGPGYLEYILFYLSDGDIFVALFANSYINNDMLREYALASLIGGFSAITGYIYSKPILFHFTRMVVSQQLRKIMAKIAFILFSVVIVIFTLAQGGNIFSFGDYGNALQEKIIGSPIGTLNIIFLYFFFLSLLLFYKRDQGLKKQNFFFIILSIFLVGFLATRGVRQDPFGLVLTVIMVYFFQNPKKNILLYSIAFFILVWFFTVVSGQFRYDVSLSNPLGYLFSFIKNNPEGNAYLNLDTASSIVGTFHFAYLQVVENGNLLLGQSYFDWLPRTLPSFLSPNRPEALAWKIELDGEFFSLGGVQDIAEQYWNFGPLGVIMGSFLIALLVGSFTQTFLRENILFNAIPFVWLATLPRWHWYQSFVLYKGFLTMIILVCIVVCIYTLFSNLNNREK